MTSRHLVRSPAPPSVRTIVIDPTPLSRYGLATLFSTQADFEVVRSVRSARHLGRSPRADLIVVRIDGDSVGHGHLSGPVVEVRLDDSPHRIIAAARRAAARRPATPPPSAPGLSPREFEVIALVAAGHTDHEIADALFLSVRTVRSHLDRIRHKTGQRRRAELTRWYVERGEA